MLYIAPPDVTAEFAANAQWDSTGEEWGDDDESLYTAPPALAEFPLNVQYVRFGEEET